MYNPFKTLYICESRLALRQGFLFGFFYNLAENKTNKYFSFFKDWFIISSKNMPFRLESHLLSYDWI